MFFLKTIMLLLFAVIVTSSPLTSPQKRADTCVISFNDFTCGTDNEAILTNQFNKASCLNMPYELTTLYIHSCSAAYSKIVAYVSPGCTGQLREYTIGGEVVKGVEVCHDVGKFFSSVKLMK